MANDAIVAASDFVMAVQTVVARRLNPFETGVVTIGSFDGKGQFNVIKDSVTLEGDVRGLTDETKATIEKEIKRLTHGLEEMYGVTCELEYNDDYPALYNNPAFTEYAVDILKNNLEDIPVEICEAQPHQKISPITLKRSRVCSSMPAQHLKTGRSIRTTIRSLQSVRNHC